MEEKFKDLYNQLIDENEEALKSAQQKLKSTSKRNTRPAITFTISGVFALMCFIIAENAQKIYIKVLFIIVGLLAILLCFNIFKKIKKRNEKDDDLYNAIYQNKIIKSLMQLFYDEPYVCMPKIGITHDVFNKIQFKNFDSYVFSNLLVGTMNKNCSFKISNVYATEYRAGTSNSNNEKVIFSGIVVEIELPKSLDYYLYITKKENILLSGLEIAFK